MSKYDGVCVRHVFIRYVNLILFIDLTPVF